VREPRLEAVSGLPGIYVTMLQLVPSCQGRTELSTVTLQ